MTAAPTTVLGRLLELHGEDPTALAVLDKRRGVWHPRTRAEVLGRVAALADGFVTDGLAAGETLILVADDGLDWLVVDLAAQAVGLRVCALPAATPERILAAALRATGATVAVASGYAAAERVLDVADAEGIALRAVLDTQELKPGAIRDPRHRALDELLTTEGDVAGLAARVAALEPTDVAVLAVGTAAERGGDPVRLNHAALLRSARLAATAFDLGPKDRVLAFRAMADPTDRCTTTYAAVVSGALLAIPESRAEVDAALYEIAPTYVHVTRRWMDDVTTSIWARLESSSGLKGLLARGWTRRILAGRPLRGPLATLMARYPIVEKLGLDRARNVLVSGSALGALERDFAAALRLPVRPGYALSEAGGVVTVGDALTGEPGDCGHPLPGIDLELDPADGSLVLRDEASGLRLDTGDMARIEDGRLVLVGRRHDPVGDTPEAAAASLALEVALRDSIFVREAVVAERDGRTVVVVEPSPEVLMRWASDAGIDFATLRGLVATPEAVAHLRGILLEAGAPHGLTGIDDVVVLSDPLEEVPGVLTASDRVRRDVLLAHALRPATAGRAG